MACLYYLLNCPTIFWNNSQKKFIFSSIDVGKSQTRKKLKPGSLTVLNMSKKMSSRQCLSQELHRKRLIKILIMQPTNTINSDADQKTQMPRNLVIMIIWLEFKEMFPTLRVIHADDLIGKGHGIMIIKFQKNICLCGAYTGDIWGYIFRGMVYTWTN